MKKLVALFIVALLITLFGAYRVLISHIPDPEKLGIHHRPTEVYDLRGRLIGTLGSERYTPLDKISEHLINAVVATEDSRFFKHRGIDFISIFRALLVDLLHMRIKQGGSTITQQLVKIAYLSPEKTFLRKLKEALLAIEIERKLSKKQIIEIYLNRIYFGFGAYGVSEASWLYFGKPPSDLSLKEAAFLAGLIRAPSRYSPYRNIHLAEKRAEIVLKRMEEEGFIKPSERRKAQKMEIRLRSLSQSTDTMGYVLSFVKDFLMKRFSKTEGFKVYTTIIREHQIKAIEAIQKGLEEIERRGPWKGPVGHQRIASVQQELRSLIFKVPESIKKGIHKAKVLRVYPQKAILSVSGTYGLLLKRDALWSKRVYRNGSVVNIKNFSLEKILQRGDIIHVRYKGNAGGIPHFYLTQKPDAEAAIVLVDYRRGYVTALVGGYSYRESPFNRAVYSRRQIGSIVKPFIYTLAFSRGYKPWSLIEDTPITFYPKNGRIWKPRNHDGRYHGSVTLRYALINSLNVATVRISKELGLQRIRNLFKNMGFKSIPDDMSITLGSVTASPLEMATFYTLFTNKGAIKDLIIIRKIVNEKGRVVYYPKVRERRIFSPEAVKFTNSILRDVVSKGTGRKARIRGLTVYGKTGTTDDFRDAWFVGFTKGLLAVVWIGHDDGTSLGRGMSGGEVAAPVWRQLFKSFK